MKGTNIGYFLPAVQSILIYILICTFLIKNSSLTIHLRFQLHVYGFRINKLLMPEMCIYIISGHLLINMNTFSNRPFYIWNCLQCTFFNKATVTLMYSPPPCKVASSWQPLQVHSHVYIFTFTKYGYFYFLRKLIAIPSCITTQHRSFAKKYKKKMNNIYI